jgi:hypothetical protein
VALGEGASQVRTDRLPPGGQGCDRDIVIGVLRQTERTKIAVIQFATSSQLLYTVLGLPQHPDDPRITQTPYD